MTPPVASSSAGLAAAIERFKAASEELLGATMLQDEDADAARALAEQIEAKLAVEANVAVLRAYDEMTGELLDITA